MKKSLVLAVMGAMLLFTLAAQADTGYVFNLTTHYQLGGCDVNGVCGSPDTGFLTITNNGSSNFTGTITLQNDGGAPLLETYLGGLTAGASVSLASGPEGSNQGGFGANGLLVTISGLLNGVDAVSLSVHDGDIHSGTFRTSPCDGINTDAFVLQGGSPVGCDNGDGFETTQADGHYTFRHDVNGQVPEPASLALLGSGLIGLAGRIRKRWM